MIPYGRQDLTDADIAAVTEVLRSDFLTQGPAVPRFEQAVADYCGAAYAVAVNSATSALHLACLALDLGPCDWLWTSPNTFVASANCARYCGALVDFVDIDPRTYNLSASALAAKLEQAERIGRLPKVVLPVHFAGQSCDMRAIDVLAKRYGFRVLEDASHAIGGRYEDMPIGSCRYSDISVFSFHPVKIITTGEGGMALTNHEELTRRMVRLRSHGITRDPAEMTQTPDGPWDYQQIELGFNHRMTEIQAALGFSQLQRLDDYVRRRHVLADAYDDLLKDLPLQRPYRNPDHASALHLYPVQVEQNRRVIFESLRHAGIGVNVHYIPVHTQPYYRQLGFKLGDYPEAEAYSARAISLPLFPRLSDDELLTVVTAVREQF
jgi:UDP-4-amino-4,6-dideoxy-N-acetyl-beta-L-altrosamine transaminase